MFGPHTTKKGEYSPDKANTSAALPLIAPHRFTSEGGQRLCILPGWLITPTWNRSYTRLRLLLFTVKTAGRKQKSNQMHEVGERNKIAMHDTIWFMSVANLLLFFNIWSKTLAAVCRKHIACTRCHLSYFYKCSLTSIVFTTHPSQWEALHTFLFIMEAGRQKRISLELTAKTFCIFHCQTLTMSYFCHIFLYSAVTNFCVI